MLAEVAPSLVVVMAGYAKDNQLRPLAQRWLRALRSISWKLVLVYDQDHLDGVPDSCQDSDDVELLVERHAAYDFGSYRRGLQRAEQRGWLDRATHVLLCNDSMIGPFWDLATFVDPMLISGDQLWCIADSYLYRPHLQSYFILMGRELFTHPRIRRFFDNVVPQPSRHDVIQAYELGLSKLVCQLGFSWRAFLSTDQMLDPRNGEPMGNITAYPLCMLQKGVPLVKVKALTDPKANYDGIGQTCSYISRHYPELWRELWDAYALQSLWQSNIPVGILLDQEDLPCLADRLAWIQSHPHTTLKAIIAVDQDAIDLRANLMHQFKDELENGVLSILLVDDVSDIRSGLIKMLAGVGTDWIVFSQHMCWQQPGALQLQIRRIAEQTNRKVLDGRPKVWSQRYCLTEDGLAQVFAEGVEKTERT